MAPRNDLVGVFEATVLTLHSPLEALLAKVLLDVFSGHGGPALVWTRYPLVSTALGSREMVLEASHIPRPLTALSLMRAVDLELVDSLLKMDVSEMVETRRAAAGAGVVGGDPPLDAALTVVLPTADHLSRIPQHLVAHLTDQLVRNLAGEFERVSIGRALLFIQRSTVHCHYLQET